MSFITLTVGNERGVVEAMLRTDQFVALVPFLEVERARATPKVTGTLIRFESGPDVFVRETVAEIWERIEKAERQALGIHIDGAMTINPQELHDRILGKEVSG